MRQLFALLSEMETGAREQDAGLKYWECGAHGHPNTMTCNPFPGWTYSYDVQILNELRELAVRDGFPCGRRPWIIII